MARLSASTVENVARDLSKSQVHRDRPVYVMRTGAVLWDVQMRDPSPRFLASVVSVWRNGVAVLDRLSFVGTPAQFDAAVRAL